MNCIKRLILLPLLALLMVGRMGTAADVPDLSTPQSAVAAFVDAHNRGALTESYRCLDVAPDNQVLLQLEELTKQSSPAPQLRLTQVIANTEGDTSTLTVTSELKLGPQDLQVVDTVKARRSDGKWRLIPLTRAELDQLVQRRPDPPVVLPLLIGMCAHPGVFLEGRAAARVSACRSNLKQLATAAIFHVQDHDEVFKLRADAFRAALLPFFKGRGEVFHCPADQPGAVSYSFNHHLQGVSLANIEQYTETIMIYEGKKGVLDFRHDGRALVAMVDGQARLVTPQEATKLRWKP